MLLRVFILLWRLTHASLLFRDNQNFDERITRDYVSLQDSHKLLRTAAGPAEESACQEPLPSSSATSENEPEPPIAAEVIPGQRVRMPAFEGLEYQLFLPAAWKSSDAAGSYPVVLFLHGYGDGKFTVMNSQSLPRLLSKNQSTVFDPRSCWCLDSKYTKVQAKREAIDDSRLAFVDEVEDLRSPMADCDFSETFKAIVVMPQGWVLPDSSPGWTKERLGKVEQLMKHVLVSYHGSAERVTLTGQSMGGAGAWDFATSRPSLWSAVNIICAPPGNMDLAGNLEGVPVWLVGWTGDGAAGNDDAVVALKRRRRGAVRYTRYISAPPPPDPKYRDLANHASYDLIYRDPRLWDWVFQQKNSVASQHWEYK